MEEQFKEISKLLKHLLALQLYKAGVTQEAIGKHLKIAKGSVNVLLKGVKRGEVTGDESIKAKEKTDPKGKSKNG